MFAWCNPLRACKIEGDNLPGPPNLSRTSELREPTLKVLDSIKWYLCHGNTYEALQYLESLEMDLDAADEERKDSTTHKLLRAVEEFHTYIANNQAFIPNYGERYRQGERISTGFVESAVNYVVAKRFTKRQWGITLT